MGTDTYTMAFLHACALDKERVLLQEEREVLRVVRGALQQADEIIICLVGKAGRLGESIVGTGLLEGALQAFTSLKKAGTPLKILIDTGVRALFEQRLYQEKYWPEINIVTTTHTANIQQIIEQEVTGKHVLILDLHGGNDGMPYLQLQETARAQIAILGRLFRVGVRSYAERGPERRYADFCEALFALPVHTIDGALAQPTILLTDEDNARYPQLAAEWTLDPAALHILCFFQSVVLAKCYERWDEVLQLLCAYFAQHFPAQKINFLLACGPDGSVPENISQAELADWLQNFSGVAANARVMVRETPSLRDLAVLAAHVPLVLSNDTGPGHIAGALGAPTVTVYLPGNIYSQRVWSSSRSHRAVSLAEHTFSYSQLEAAVTWSKTAIINTIPPEDVLAAILDVLPPAFKLKQAMPVKQFA